MTPVLKTLQSFLTLLRVKAKLYNCTIADLLSFPLLTLLLATLAS